jgi:hypothetical protein
VLGDAALRADAAELALRFTDEAPDGDATRRIRATAHVDLPALGRRAAALATLEELAVSGGREADRAAYARLSACLPPVKAKWHEPSADVLSVRHERTAISLKVMSQARRGEFDNAARDAEQLPDEAWAAEIHLKLARIRGDHLGIRKATARFLRFPRDHSSQLEAALALAKGRQLEDLERAGQLMTAIAHDPNAPPRVRSDAFHGLLLTLADRGEWEDADRDWRVWRRLSDSDLDSPDGRLSAWQARLMHHGAGRD